MSQSSTVASHSGAYSTLGPAQQAQLDVIMAHLREQLPVLTAGAVISVQLISRVKAVLVKNMAEILSASLIAGGMAVLLPALTVAIVNAVGFTASGVVAGSLAAAFQSAVYGAFTGGVFSTLQSFGATAVMAPPVAIAIASVAVVGGGGYFAYKKYKSRRGQIALPEDDAVEDDVGSIDPKTPETLRRITWNDSEGHEEAEASSSKPAAQGLMQSVNTGASAVHKSTVHVYNRLSSIDYSPVTERAATVGDFAATHMLAAGHGATTVLASAGTHVYSAANMTIDFFGSLRKQEGIEKGEHKL